MDEGGFQVGLAHLRRGLLVLLGVPALLLVLLRQLRVGIDLISALGAEIGGVLVFATAFRTKHSDSL
jgi:hypothetical protein